VLFCPYIDQPFSSRRRSRIPTRVSRYKRDRLTSDEKNPFFIDFLPVSSGSAFSNVLKAKEDLQKSPEQLEQEKRSVIAQRVPALQVDGKSKEDLAEKVSIHPALSLQLAQRSYFSS
jgi:hypothetical protein